jgi:hypothetical protein
LADLTDQQLKNVFENYRRKGMTSDPVYIQALADQARRIGKGLDSRSPMMQYGTPPSKVAS